MAADGPARAALAHLGAAGCAPAPASRAAAAPSKDPSEARPPVGEGVRVPEAEAGRPQVEGAGGASSGRAEGLGGVSTAGAEAKRAGKFPPAAAAGMPKAEGAGSTRRHAAAGEACAPAASGAPAVRQEGSSRQAAGEAPDLAPGQRAECGADHADSCDPSAASEPRLGAGAGHAHAEGGASGGRAGGGGGASPSEEATEMALAASQNLSAGVLAERGASARGEGGEGLDAARRKVASDKEIASSIKLTMNRLQTMSLPVALLAKSASGDALQQARMPSTFEASG